LNPIPIPQPSSFILPPLNFIPLAGGYFTTATMYATNFLPGSHPLRLSVALEHSAFLWDCVHDHEGSRRLARRAIKDVYRAQEAMEDSEFEAAAELVGILGRMMKRKSWEGTPRVGASAAGSPAPAGGDNAQGNGAPIPPVPFQQISQVPKYSNEGTPVRNSPAQMAGTRSRSSSTKQGSGQTPVAASEQTPRAESQRLAGGSQEVTPRSGTQRQSGDTTPRARHLSVESGGSTTPRVFQSVGGRSPATPSTVRTIQPGSGGSVKGKSPVVGNSTPIAPSVAASLASDTIRASPTLRRSPPIRSSPTQESTYMHPR
jgi:hypothetical protein